MNDENGAKGLEEALALRREVSREVVDVDEPSLQLVIFDLGGEWFAFYGEKIREVLPYGGIFFVPGCPPSMEGVINVRGDIASVIRIAPLLGVNAEETPRRHTAILLGRGGGMESGIRVDEVLDVAEVPQSAIQPPHAAIGEPLRRYVQGALRHRDRPVVLLDLDRLFADYREGLG